MVRTETREHECARFPRSTWVIPLWDARRIARAGRDSREIAGHMRNGGTNDLLIGYSNANLAKHQSLLDAGHSDVNFRCNRAALQTQLH